MAKRYFRARYLIKLRLEMGLSPDKLAELAGLSNGSIIREAESGETERPRADTIKKICSVFKDCRPDDFWSDKPEPAEDLKAASDQIESSLGTDAKSESSGSPGLDALVALHHDNIGNFQELVAKLGDRAATVFADSLRETRAEVSRCINLKATYSGARAALKILCRLLEKNPETLETVWPRIEALTDFLMGKSTSTEKVPEISD